MKSGLNTSSHQFLNNSIERFIEDSYIQPPYQIYIYKYPGQEIYYYISTIDALCRNVYSTVIIYIVRNCSYRKTNCSQPNFSIRTIPWLSFKIWLQKAQIVPPVVLTVYTNDELNIIDVVIMFSLYKQTSSLQK